ncbi:hypothetical protein TK11N_19670 [Tetragenococcus koreensis]|uniref:Uncharacterized protein n=1 Tax=Tetragenococcus koreensis TaxID=290335 RepID=A0AAN4UCY9_9ENTE|nr:hypothetical protein TK11N_19670 [Tetragenococcus koreensis]GEQ52634.1 hypothetical protein TK12N_19780 [Tetragenococcus koreensis]GEQ55169.1 hypothetical protein TK2N_20130 [Tetragenococcus koreensis]GEQ57635.1 hypothetical protein TK4N_19780 [Tetragenococcus koreensis]GEQ60129.1 hypothetical protein TK6N_19680 [Tetragenococcus koreensis]
MLKIEGTIQTLATVFNRVDLAKSIKIFSVKVAPMPPIVISAEVNITSLVEILVGSCPLDTAAIFADIPAINIGVDTALKDHDEIPIVNRNAGIKLSKIKPGNVCPNDCNGLNKLAIN